MAASKHYLFETLFANKLYIISDSVAVLKKAIADGVTIIQLRDKLSGLNGIRRKAEELADQAKNFKVLFIINDHPELAVEAGADGVHIGQDFSTLEARRIVGTDLMIGKSTHSIEQGITAEKEGADYISVGPVFATPTKPGRPPVGLEYVRQAAKEIKIPFVAIGGICLDNIDQVLNAGARTIGIVRAADDAPRLLEIIKRNRDESNYQRKS
ncbi:MAG: thiamine phosphate synthase [bacterium]